jgi:hypothetical protein
MARWEVALLRKELEVRDAQPGCSAANKAHLNHASAGLYGQESNALKPTRPRGIHKA